MAVTTTNLGVITAYGDAVAAGYTGTKAEWQALMASYATVGQQAVDAKNAAVAAKDTAVAKATEATTAATTATTKASEASASAQSIAQSAAQIQENTDDISQLKSKFTAVKEDLSDISEITDNLFDKRKIVIGIQAEGKAVSAGNRALSDAMKINGAGVVEAFNLPSNIKYEIEYYSGESASTFTTNSGGWNTTAGIVRASKNYPYIRILFGTVDNSAFTESDFDSLRMQVTVGAEITGYKDHITALDFVARKAGESLEYNNNVNLFDTKSVVIGINAEGALAVRARALSGAMKVDGTALIKAYNLPSNIKYEIEYYSGENASTFLGAYSGWITDINEHIYAQDGSYVRLLFASVDNTAISQTDIDNVKILVMKDTKFNKEYFKICTWNVGLWYNGNPNGMDMDLLYEWYRVIGNVDADLFMTQEAPNVLSDGSTLTVTDLMGFKYDYINLPIDSDGIYMAKEICSKQPFYNVTKNNFSAGGRLYWKAHMYINGRKVCIINTHLNFDDTYRADEITELLDIMDDEEYVIVCGDFNTKTTEEYNAFTNAGYKIANCGIFGNFITCPNDANNKMLDNCIVSPNISIQSVKTVDGTGVNHISDHVALVVELGIK